MTVKAFFWCRRGNHRVYPLEAILSKNGKNLACPKHGQRLGFTTRSHRSHITTGKEDYKSYYVRVLNWKRTIEEAKQKNQL